VRKLFVLFVVVFITFTFVSSVYADPNLYIQINNGIRPIPGQDAIATVPMYAGSERLVIQWGAQPWTGGAVTDYDIEIQCTLYPNPQDRYPDSIPALFYYDPVSTQYPDVEINGNTAIFRYAGAVPVGQNYNLDIEVQTYTCTFEGRCDTNVSYLGYMQCSIFWYFSSGPSPLVMADFDRIQFYTHDWYDPTIIIPPTDVPLEPGQDTDGDGILDEDDVCPFDPGLPASSINANGCPVIQ